MNFTQDFPPFRLPGNSPQKGNAHRWLVVYPRHLSRIFSNPLGLWISNFDGHGEGFFYLRCIQSAHIDKLENIPILKLGEPHPYNRH